MTFSAPGMPPRHRKSRLTPKSHQVSACLCVCLYRSGTGMRSLPSPEIGIGTTSLHFLHTLCSPALLFFTLFPQSIQSYISLSSPTSIPPEPSHSGLITTLLYVSVTLTPHSSSACRPNCQHADVSLLCIK